MKIKRYLLMINRLRKDWEVIFIYEHSINNLALRDSLRSNNYGFVYKFRTNKWGRRSFKDENR